MLRYGQPMNEAGVTMADDMDVENVLAHELAHGDVVLGTLGPIMGHLLAGHADTLFNDRIVARVRGMVAHIAGQFATFDGEEADGEEGDEGAAAVQEQLRHALSGNLALIGHCHALALESQLAERLQAKNAIDPVLPPLIQALIASNDAAIAGTAMGALATQARFIQHQRRVELPLFELPQAIFEIVMSVATSNIDGIDETALREGYDPHSNRLGLLARLVDGMQDDSRPAFAPSHAGVALFLSALASASGQSRDLIAVSTDESQLARLALALRAAGLKPFEVEEHFLLLHPNVTLPEDFASLRIDRAAQLLSGSERQSLD